MSVTVGRVFKLILFYSIFHGVLAIFFVGLMAVFLKTLNSTQPKLILSESVIGTSPGLVLHPMPENPVENTFIKYSTNHSETEEYWTTRLDTFLKPYLNLTPIENAISCNNNVPEKGKVCDFRLDHTFIPCLPAFNYGYNSEKTSPCIFLKLNRIFGWIPDCFDTSSVPEDMPSTLIAEIQRTDANLSRQLVWVECSGETLEDRLNLGPVAYFPQQGFHKMYFPYINAPGYTSPLVAVSFEKPERHVVINIECKAWARNIRHDRKNRLGLVRFRLQIE